MAYRQLATTAAQTAANVAGGIVGSLVLANQVESADNAAKAVTVVFDALFERLNDVVDADNETLRVNEEPAVASAPAKGRPGKAPARGRKTGSSNGKVTLATARSMELKGGAFEGVSLEALLDISAGQAETDYGYGDGERGGYEYLEWLASDRNNNDYTRPRAELVLAAFDNGEL